MKWKLIICGICAGAVNGILGAGGGMILVPLLSGWVKIPDDSVFTTSLSITIPICIVSVFILGLRDAPQWKLFLPIIAGGTIGGIFAGKMGAKIPATWLHRMLGGLILWGGMRYLCM